MRFLIMTNGEYGELDWYSGRAARFNRIVCVDGAASRARELGIVPHWVVGDMDSISESDRLHLMEAGAKFNTFPSEKDSTDTQLAFELAEKEGGKKIEIWGGTGSRLDHTFSNILSASPLSQRGVEVVFESPAMAIYLTKDRLHLPGAAGDTVSLLVLGDRAAGVNLQGFRYPLTDAVLEGNWQWAVSNIIDRPNPLITVSQGVLAVIHFKILVP